MICKLIVNNYYRELTLNLVKMDKELRKIEINAICKINRALSLELKGSIFEQIVKETVQEVINFTKMYNDEIKLLEEIRDDFVNKFDNVPQIKRVCNVMITEFKARKEVLNLDEVIKKAKPNMDKIKDVDKHIDSIR